MLGSLGLAAVLTATLPHLVSMPPPAAGLPVEAQQKPGGVVELVRLTVSPVGRVQDCRIALSSGYPFFDAQVCAYLRAAQFAPGTDTEGQPTFSLLTARFHWPVEQIDNKNQIPDVVLNLKHMPVGAPDQPVAEIALTVDQHGHVESCDLAASSGVKALDAAACTAGVEAAAITPVKDNTGVSVRSVQSLGVGFEAYTRLIFRKNSSYAGLGDAGPFFPERAQRLNVGGYAILACDSDLAGILQNCVVKVEQPDSYAFGQAALKMVAAKWMTVAPGAPGRVVVKVYFPPSGNFRIP